MGKCSILKRALISNLLEAMLYNKDIGFNDKFLRLKQKLSLNLAILSSIYRGESIESEKKKQVLEL